MKNIFYRLLFCIITIFLAGNILSAKQTETEGTSFWFALPKVNSSTGEAAKGTLSGDYYEIWVESRVNTAVRFYDAHQTQISTQAVIGGKLTAIAIPAGKLHDQSETVESEKAMYVEADDPISLTVYIAYNFTGEAYKILPVSALGKEYYTLNLYNDYLLFRNESRPRSTPGEFLIVATENGTNIEISPAAKTAKKVNAGGDISITLNKGQSYLVMSDTNYLSAHNAETDLTGSHIVASKPVAVFSGHSKGAYPLLSSKYFGIRCDWSRNLMIESMIPIELLGKNYVIVPNQYSDRTKGYNQNLIADIRGDMIKFVATKDNTIINQVNTNGSSIKLATIKKAGEWFEISSLQAPTCFTASEPVLVGQYGKTWMYWAGGIIVYKDGQNKNSKEDKLQTPTQSGQGQLYTVIPTEQWTSYCEFNSPNSVKNWFNLIFKTGDEKYLSINGEPLMDEYGSSVTKIENSSYSYLSQLAGNGFNYIESSNPNALFACYSYGDMDGSNTGFAYGYPAAMNIFSYCADSIEIEGTMNCNSLVGSVSAINLAKDSACAAIQSFSFNKNTCKNAVLTSDVKLGSTNGEFSVEFPDQSQIGHIELIATTKSGTTVSRKFDYIPETISVNSDSLNFGLLQPDESKDADLLITNSSEAEIIVKSIYFENDLSEFSIITSPTENFSIAPGETKKFTIRVQIKERNTTLANKIYLEMNCSTQLAANIYASTGGSVFTMNDIEWKDVQLGGEYQKTKEVVITNEGTTPGYITGYSLSNPDDKHFTFSGLDSVSAENYAAIEPNGGKLTLEVTYDPMGEKNVEHSQTLTIVSSNTNASKLTSTWKGNAIDTLTSVPTATEMPSGITNIIPNPAGGCAKICYSVCEKCKVNLAVFNSRGQLIKILVDEEKIPGNYQAEFNTDGVSSGTYSCRITLGTTTTTRNIVVIK